MSEDQIDGLTATDDEIATSMFEDAVNLGAGLTEWLIRS